MRKGLSLITAIGVATSSVPAAFGETYDHGVNPPSSYYIDAPVVRADPILTTRTVRHPVRQCTAEITRERDHYQDYERNHSHNSYLLPGLFGGMIGGLIGNQFGGGSGKKALTIAGAVAGSSIARDMARQRDRDHRPTRVCRTTYETEVIDDVDGYDVTYEYGGQHFHKRTSEHPGGHVRVRVQVSPYPGG
jgi:uncharacterized protein YcfJ